MRHKLYSCAGWFVDHGFFPTSEESLLPKDILPNWKPPTSKEQALDELKQHIGWENLLKFDEGGYAPNVNWGDLTGEDNEEEEEETNKRPFNRGDRPGKPTTFQHKPGGGGGGIFIDPDESEEPGESGEPSPVTKAKSTALLLLLGTILLNS